MARSHSAALGSSEVLTTIRVFHQWRNTSEKRNAGTHGNALMRILMTAMEIASDTSKETHRYHNACLGLLLFAIGSFIYLAFNSTDLYLYKWFCIDANANWIQNLRHITTSWQVPLWIRWNLSDGLWLLSYLLIIDSIWDSEDSGWNNIFGISMLLLAVVSEWLQAEGFIPGTGDWYDVLTYIISYIIFQTLKFYEKKY